MAIQLLDQTIGGGPVPGIAGLPEEMDQRPAGQDVVDVEFLDAIAGEGAVPSHLGIDQTAQMIEPQRLPGAFVQDREAPVETSILVAPGPALVVRVAARIGIEVGYQHDAVTP